MGHLTPTIGIVCGMVSEVRALGGWADDPRIGIGISGARPDRAEAEARRLADGGCRALMSWGVAGGLDPALAPGDLVIPGEVVSEEGESWAASPDLRTAVAAGVSSPPRLLKRGGEGQGEGGRLLGLDRMVLSAAEKAALYGHTGAVAVDMESHRVVRVAAEAGLPAVTVRAIGDPADRALPDLAARALGGDGRPRIGPVLAGLLRRPGDLGTLLRVRRDTDAALAALTRVAGAMIPTVLETR